MSIADQLSILNDTKQNIKYSLESKGYDLTGLPFADYVGPIDELFPPIAAPRPSAWDPNYYNSLYQQASANAWYRPNDWVYIDDPNDGEQKLVGVYAVFDTDSNWVTFAVADDYTVDWGDGVVEDYTSGQTASHNYDYADLSGTDCSRGYRQAIITITPQEGNNMWAINLGIVPANTGSEWSSKWLDIAVYGNGITIDKGQSQAPMRFLERFRWAGVTSQGLGQFFSDDSSLQVVEMETSGVTDMNNMFSNCRSLVVGPTLSTASVTNMQQMFRGCTSLITVPTYNTSSMQNCIEMFAGCTKLVTIPEFSTSNGSEMYAMFDGCSSLTVLPQISTAANGYMYAFARGCRSLQTVPEFSYASNFNYNATYEHCENLKKVTINFQGASGDASFMFANCFSLVDANLTNCGGLGNAGTMFAGCRSLSKLRVTGISTSFSIESCNFGPQGLIQVFNDLATVSSATINISGNWGASALTQPDRDIAINKGWTISG